MINIQEWAKGIAEICKYPAGATMITILGLRVMPYLFGNKEELSNKVTVDICSKKHNDIQKELSDGKLQFNTISDKLENIFDKFNNFYDKNDRSSMRILDEIGGKDGLKDRILTLEVKFEDYTQKNGR